MKKALSVILSCCLISSCSYRVYPGRQEVQAKQAEEPVIFILTPGQETVIGITVVAGLLAVRYLVLRMMTAETALNEVKTELKARGEEIKGLGKAFAVRGRQLETKTKELATVQREKEGLIRANAELGRRPTRRDLEAEQRKTLGLQREKERLTKANEELSARLGGEELEEVRRQLTQVRKEKEDLEKVEADLAQANVDLIRRGQEVTRLSEELATARQQLIDLQTQLEARPSPQVYEDLKKEKAEVQRKCKHEEGMKLLFMKDKVELERENKKLKKPLDPLKKAVFALAVELDELKRRIATTTDDIQGAAAQAQAILTGQQNELHKTNQDYATLTELFYKVQEDLEKKQKELTEVQGQLDKAQEDLREELGKTADLQREKERLTEANRVLEKRPEIGLLAAVRAERDQLKEDLNSMREEIGRIGKRNTELELRPEQADLDELQEQLTQAQTDLKDERQNKAKLFEDYEATEGELRRLIGKCTEFETQLEEQQVINRILTRDLERMKKTLAEKEAVQAEKEPEREAVPPAEAEIAVTNPAAEAEAADRKEEPATGVPEGKT